MPLGRSCKICNSELKRYTEAVDETPATWCCQDCGLVQLSLTPEETEVWCSYYTDDGRYHRERVLAGFESFEARYEHDLQLARLRMENLMRVVSGGNLLDVGASNGAFVNMARQYGFCARGLEPDCWVVEEARQRGYAVGLTMTFEWFCVGALDATEDVICFIDSFEHLLDPHLTLKETARLLSDGGLLMIEMPDADAIGFEELGPKWKHFKPREHAYLYGLGHVLQLFNQHGFCLIDTIVPYPDRRVYYARRKVE